MDKVNAKEEICNSPFVTSINECMCQSSLVNAVSQPGESMVKQRKLKKMNLNKKIPHWKLRRFLFLLLIKKNLHKKMAVSFQLQPNRNLLLASAATVHCAALPHATASSAVPTIAVKTTVATTSVAHHHSATARVSRRPPPPPLVPPPQTFPSQKPP